MSLGQSKAAWCDCTGSLAGKGKLSFWKPFANAPETTISALTNLGSAGTQTDEDINELERFICRVYQNNKKNDTLSDLRWMMFRTKQSLSEKLPPTRAALFPALKRANYQAMSWFNDITLHYITLHYITLHYITLHYVISKANYTYSNQWCINKVIQVLRMRRPVLYRRQLDTDELCRTID